MYGECFHGIDWIICGGESGHNARPIYPDWARSLRDQCQEASVPFFFKQWGEWAPEDDYVDEWDNIRCGEFHGNAEFIESCCCTEGTQVMYRAGKKAAGSMLDGVEYKELPNVDR